MPISDQTLAAIQSAGAAVYAADVQLRSAVEGYAAQVQAAIQTNPFDVRNDSLFEEWKTVARLSKAMSQIEQELRKVYGASSTLVKPALTGQSGVPQLLSAIEHSSALVEEISATDVIAKRGRQYKVKKLQTAASTNVPTGNAAKVMAHLTRVLSVDTFTRVNRSALAAEIGLAKGSIGAAINKLVAMGLVRESDTGEFKLVGGS